MGIRTKGAAAAVFFIAAGVSLADSLYSFHIVAKTGDVIGGKTIEDIYEPAMNSSGSIVFWGRYENGLTGVFSPTGAIFLFGDSIGGAPVGGINPYVAMNNPGVPLFASGTAVYTPTSVLVKSNDVIGGKTIGILHLVPHSFNDSGTVAFFANFPGGKGVFTQTSLLAKTGDTIDGQTLTDLDDFVALNNGGVAAFAGFYANGYGLFTQNHALAKTGDFIGGETLTGVGFNINHGAINDVGTAAFVGRYSSASGPASGIFTQDGVIAKRGDTVSGDTLFHLLNPAINNRGMVAYIGHYQNAPPHGIFTQSGRVIQTGDVIEGKTFNSIRAGTSPLINDHGDIAFGAEFADGTKGIVVATLMSPDPPPCTTLGASSILFGASGGPGVMSVTAGPSCNWSPFTHVDWINVSSPGAFSGSGTPGFTVAPNPNPTPRSGAIALSFGPPFKPHQVFTINQAGLVCTYALGASASTIVSAGGTGSIALTSNSAQCPWNATSGAGWITVTSAAAGLGSATIDYSVAPNTGAPRTATLTIGGQTFTITQQGPPLPSSLNPVSGSGAARTFVFTFSDPDGWQDLSIVNVLINNFLDGRNACYLAYDRPSNVLYVVADSGGGLFGLVLNGSGSVGNSQCTVNGAGSSASGSGNTLMLTLSLSFNQATFAGEKVTYLAARDLALNNSGWRTQGVWSVPGLSPVFPAILSVTPGEGTGAAQQFTVTYRDAANSANLRTAQLLINADLNANMACYVGYDHANNVLYLVNDLNFGLVLPGIVPNSGSGMAQNSQCILNGAGTIKSENGTDLILTVSLTFKAGFAGPKVAYAGVQTTLNANSDWHALAHWNVP